MHEWEKWDVSVVILLTRLLYENSCKLRLYKAKVLIMMMLHVAMLSSYGSIPFRFTLKENSRVKSHIFGRASFTT
jgi:hypothetical protein